METSPIYDNYPANNSQPSSRTWKAAREFEALFTSLMMKSMRKTVFEDGLIEKSLGEKIYTDMLDVEYAKIISKNASFGLAEQIVKQIENMNSNDSMMQALQNIGNQSWMIDSRLVPGRKEYLSAASLSQRIAHWNTYIDEASAYYNVDRHLIAAVISQESAGNPYAVSRAGAKGLMQLMDSTAQTMGVQRVFHPRENIMAGTRYLEQLLTECKGNEALALASYNAGPAAVKKYGGIPPYRETEEYVTRVLDLRDTFKQQDENRQVELDTNGE